MSNESPARILYDENGNAIGVLQDDTVYRLQVEAKLAAGTALAGTVKARPYDSDDIELSDYIRHLLEDAVSELKKINVHLASITDERITPGDEED